MRAGDQEPVTSPVIRFVPLLYHELRAEPSHYSYVLTPSRFAQHLDLFARIQRQRPDGSVPLITFDDGHISNHRFALPILHSAGVRAHFFITAGWTGTRAGYMGPQHLRELNGAGHTIGAHGWTHALLTACSDAELSRELSDARDALEQWIGAPVTAVSLPGGRANARVFEACRKAGYTTVWTSAPGLTTTLASATVGRLNVLAGATDAFLERLLEPGSGVLRRAAQLSRAKAATQAILGDRLYARLWSALNRDEGADGEGMP